MEVILITIILAKSLTDTAVAKDYLHVWLFYKLKYCRLQIQIIVNDRLKIERVKGRE